MKMSSLVAYEDSESEEESFDQREKRTSVLLQTPTCEQIQDAARCNTGPATLFSDQTVPESEGSSSSLYFYSHPSESVDKQQTPLCFPKSLSDGSSSGKRPAAVYSGVRPYVPKRQRLALSADPADPKHQSEPVVGPQTCHNRILSDVSGRLKPYLDKEPGAAGIPRKLLMSLEGHHGPVNTVQWSPVPRLSHLLLSASMDKTFKVWDGAESGRCLRAYTCHSGAVRDACWTPCGRQLLTGSFDNTAVITDVETGLASILTESLNPKMRSKLVGICIKDVDDDVFGSSLPQGQKAVKVDNQFKVMCVVLHPDSPDVFLCGGYSSVVKAWDSRCCKVVKMYKAGIQQTLDILFLRGGEDFITSTDCVSRDSADRTLIAWDFQTTAKVSNQIYHERYTCPSLALHPQEESFVAQTNGNYVVLFSSQKPYRMNKRRRFEGHKVEGFAVQSDFSPDGTILASGSSTGFAHFYDFHNARMLHSFQAHSQPCLGVSQHPVLPATVVTCDWAGEIKIWH